MSARGSAVTDYCVFGLRVRSELPLPELFPAEQDGVPDVIVERGSVTAGANGIEIRDDALILAIPDVGRYRVHDGRSIVVDADPGVPDRNLRLFLLGSAFGALLHQRGLLPLHANAVEIDGKAFAFMGESGAGKSTLAAWFHDRGHRVISDDVCVVGFGVDGCPFAAPGLPRLRLWREALELMGREASGYHRSYIQTSEEFDKFDVPIAWGNATTDNMPLAGLYLLERANQLSMTRLEGVEAADAVFANTYRGAYIAAAGNQRDHWLAAVRLVRNVPVYRAAREWDLAQLDGQNQQLLDYLLAHPLLPNPVAPGDK